VSAGLLLALAGCQSPPPPATPSSSTAPSVDFAAEARAAAARQDWKAAAPLFRQAIAASPTDYKLHYELGVVGTYLDARDEAAREFRWVVSNAPPESAESRAARQWLAENGGSTGAVAAVTPAPADIPHVERVGDAGLYGQVAWTAGAGGPHATRRMQVHLTGVPGTPSQDQRYTVRTDDDGKYEFRRIVAGSYKLADRVAGKPTWRLRVEVEPGRDTALDLNPTNSVSVRDDFPE
jgi:hypothetical protein